MVQKHTIGRISVNLHLAPPSSGVQDRYCYLLHPRYATADNTVLAHPTSPFFTHLGRSVPAPCWHSRVLPLHTVGLNNLPTLVITVYWGRGWIPAKIHLHMHAIRQSSRGGGWDIHTHFLKWNKKRIKLAQCSHVPLLPQPQLLLRIVEKLKGRKKEERSQVLCILCFI